MMRLGLLCSLLTLCITATFSQTGPGGVGNNTNNILWLRAGDISGLADSGAIATWPDTSGNNNDPVQATVSDRPLWRASSINFNNKPTVQFDGADDYFDLSAVSNATSDYSIFFVYQTALTDKQYLIDVKSGKLKIPHEGGGDKAYHDGGGRGTAITGTSVKMVNWLLDDAGADIYENGANTQTGLSYTQRAFSSNRTLGCNEKANNDYLLGNIAESIIYNVALNDAERIIVENYLGAKYNLTIANDYFSHQGSFNREVAGIGRVDASNIHNDAESAKILGINTPGDLDNNEFLIFGHNGGSISSWTTSETPGASIQRIAREWRIDETGDVGTVTISIDTTYLPVKSAGYTKYAVWVDADGNFASGPTQYVLTLNGGRYEAVLVDVADNDYITVGTFQPIVDFNIPYDFGQESVSPVVVQIDLNYAVESDITVDYDVTGGTATGSGTDYTLANGTATILAGTTDTTFSISINPDSDLESDEAIIVTLSNPSSGITLGTDDEYTYTINDDDASRKIQFASTSSSGAENIPTVDFTVEIDLVDAVDTTYAIYSVTGGTATGSGSDYTLASDTVFVLPGDTTATFSVTINNDGLYEPNETIAISLSSPSANANIGTNSTYTYTINDNDNPPVIDFSLTSSSGSEGTAGGNLAVSLSTISGKNATVDYEVIGGTATGSGTDYTLASGTLTITAGSVSGNIIINVADDALQEIDETVIITLSNPGEATLGADSVHTYTITDNDNLGATGPGGVGDAETNILWLKANDISATDGDPLSVWSDASGNSNNATQATGGDRPLYDAVNPNFNNKPTVSFDGADHHFNFNTFTAPEGDYSIYFVYKSTSTDKQYLFDTKSGKIKIAHKGGGDGAYNDGGGQGVELTDTTTKLVLWSLDDAGADIYENGSNTQTGLSYTQRAIGNNTNLGCNEKSNNQYLQGDMAEVVFYNTILNDAQRTIVDNYLAAKYGLSISNDKYVYQGTYGNEVAGIGSEGANNYHTTAYSGNVLSISNASDLNSTEYLLVGHNNGSIAAWTTTGVPGDSIKRVARVWRAGETGDVGTISITIDTTVLPARPSGYSEFILWVDADGDFTSGAVQYIMSQSGSKFTADGVNISSGRYISFGIIKPIIQFQSTFSNATEAPAPANFTVGLNYPFDQDITVDYAITGGTATGGGVDYTLADGTATITTGNTSTNIQLTVVNDGVQELDETVIITLSNPSSGVLGPDSVYTFTINDDDAGRKIEFVNASVSGSENSTSVEVFIGLDVVDVTDTTTVDYAITGGTATGSGTDYTLVSGTAEILPGDTTTSFMITINNDDLYESNETIKVGLSNPSTNTNIGDSSTYTYTIIDNESAPTIDFNKVASSGSEGTVSAYLKVDVSIASGKNANIDYEVTGGTATGGVDYILDSGTLTITAGNTSGNIEITVVDNESIEIDETVIVTLSNPVNAVLGADSVHTFTISDNDNMGSEGPGGVGDAGSNILWLRSDYISGVADGGNIATWSDTSGNGNHGVQSTAGDRPNYTASNANFNNMPTVTFNGTTDFLDLTAFTHAASDYSIFMVYKSTKTNDKQYMFESKTGRMSLPHEGGGDGVIHAEDGGQGNEITGTGTKLVMWELDNAGATFYEDGTATQTGLDYSTQVAIGEATSLGSNDDGNNDFFEGDIAEVIFYNKVLNSVQRTLVTNYLADKYGIAVSNDFYGHQATHGNDIAGIGNNGGTDIHTAALSAGMLEVSNASGLDSSEYLMFGHNGGTINSWTTTEIPNSEVERISREWRIDETGNVGSISITLDTTLLAARSAGFKGYILMVSGTDDFSNNPAIYPLTYVSGSLYRADNVSITDGNYIAIGSARYLTNDNGNFSDPAKWYAGAVPGTGQTAIVAAGTAITLTGSHTVGRVEIQTGATLNLGSNTLTIDDSTIISNGTFNPGTGTVNYAKTGDQDITDITYYHLTLSGSGTKILQNNLTVNGNLILSGGTLDVDAANDFNITVNGNWNNNGGAFSAQNGTVTFGGATNQAITSNGQDFYDVVINNSSTQVTINDDVTIANQITLTDGVITTGTDTLRITNADTASLQGFGLASFVNGNLIRAVSSNTNTYAFPVGNGTAPSNYYLAEIINNNLTGLNSLYASFIALHDHSDAQMTAVDFWHTYISINPAGIWVLEPDAQPSGGDYDIRLYIANMSGLEDNMFAVLKRPVTSTSGADWTAGGGTLNGDNGTGRLVSDGFMLRKGLTGFSEFGGGEGGGGGLPIKLTSFIATAKNDLVNIEWTTETEVNNDYFTVERSQDGTEFEAIAIVEGTGNSSVRQAYKLVDEDPLNGLSYYRLKQTDFDGSYEYSDVVSVSMKSVENGKITIYPNPLSGSTLFLDIKEEITSELITIAIISSNGKEVFFKTLKTAQKLTINLPENLSSGYYIMNCKIGKEMIQRRILIK